MCKELYEKAIELFGLTRQPPLSLGLGEKPTVSLVRYILSCTEEEEIKEEIADVMIMCEQLQVIHGDVSDVKRAKLRRLAKRVNEAMK